MGKTKLISSQSTWQKASEGRVSNHKLRSPMMTEGIITPLIPILGQWAEIAFLILINRLKFLNILAQHLSFWKQAEALCPCECDIVLPVEWWHDWSLLHTSAKCGFGNGASTRPRPGEQCDCSSEEDTVGHSGSAEVSSHSALQVAVAGQAWLGYA